MTALTITIDQADYVRLCAQLCRLREKLLDIAQECASCGGTGRVTMYSSPYAAAAAPDVADEYARTEICGDCLEIREVLA